MFKRAIYLKLERFTVHNAAPAIRKWGQTLFKQGAELTGDNEVDDRLVPSLRAVPISDKVFPKLLTADWVAPNATVIGDVELDTGSSLWHGAILRGDTAKITIGKNSIVHDRVMIKSSTRDASQVSIGSNVHVGANSQLDACTLDDFAYVGMGSTIHRGVLVEPYGVVAAGSVVPEGTVVPSGQVWAGSPAKYLRDVTQEEKHQISEYMIEMQQLSQIYCEETEKTTREVLDSVRDRDNRANMHTVHALEQLLSDSGLPLDEEDHEYIEHRVLSPHKMDLVDYDFDDPNLREDTQDQTYNPYQQDFTKFPEILQMYGENFDRYQKMKEKFEKEKKGEPHSKHPLEYDPPRDESPWEKKYDDYMPKYTGETHQ